MMIGRLRVFSSVVLAVSLGAALNGCGSDDDESGASGGHSAKGGGAGRGGTSGRGGSATGGSGVTGGSGATGGTGGSFAGTTGSGGSVTSGGSGGVATGGTAGAGASSGATALGGMAGSVALGGAGGAPSYCYESLYAPIAMENDQVDFEVDYGDAATVDLSATTLSVRLRAETAGNAGGLQVYVKNGSAQNYAVAYFGWNDLTALNTFTTLTYDVSTASGSAGFDPTAIRYVGVNVNAGSTWDGANFQPATIYVDSITFSDGASADLNFNDGVKVLGVNQYNSPVAGSAVSAGICQDESGTGGMGGMSATGGSGGVSATGGSGGVSATGGSGGVSATGGSGGISATGGTTGTEGGAAGEGGAMGGEGGVDEGTGGTGTAGSTSGGTSGGGAGGTSGTSGTAGASGGISGTGGGTSGTGGGGLSGAGGSTSGAAGVSGAAGHAGAAGNGGGATNLISNGDFELGVTTGWSAWDASMFQVSPTAHAGNYSMLVTGRSDTNANILTNVTAVVSAGHSYTVTGWVRASAATSGHFTVQFDCATTSDNFVWVENPVNVDNSGWTQITGTFDYTDRCAGDTVSAVNLYLEGMAAGIDVYVDDVSMTQN
jgi:hypothetical protein